MLQIIETRHGWDSHLHTDGVLLEISTYELREFYRSEPVFPKQGQKRSLFLYYTIPRPIRGVSIYIVKSKQHCRHQVVCCSTNDLCTRLFTFVSVKEYVSFLFLPVSSFPFPFLFVRKFLQLPLLTSLLPLCLFSAFPSSLLPLPMDWVWRHSLRNSPRGFVYISQGHVTLNF